MDSYSPEERKPDLPPAIYRVGKCIPELVKLWKGYQSSLPNKISESSQNGPTLEVRIPAEHVSAANHQVRAAQLWGTDIYTDDSDLVAVLLHTGYCRQSLSLPPAVRELLVTIRVLPPQDRYISTLRNNVCSRSWGLVVGCSFRVERCRVVKKDGGMIDLKPNLTHPFPVEPSLSAAAMKRPTTKAEASDEPGESRRLRFVPEVSIMYNLCNEPWMKYSISVVADRGLKPSQFTSARLRKGEVLYLESQTRRYELCYDGQKMVKIEGYQTHGFQTGNSAGGSSSSVVDVFRWSQCKTPFPQTAMRTIGIPLPLKHVKVLEENVEWEDIQWAQTSVWVCGKEYPLSRLHFMFFP